MNSSGSGTLISWRQTNILKTSVTVRQPESKVYELFHLSFLRKYVLWQEYFVRAVSRWTRSNVQHSDRNLPPGSCPHTRKLLPLTGKFWLHELHNHFIFQWHFLCKACLRFPSSTFHSLPPYCIDYLYLFLLLRNHRPHKSNDPITSLSDVAS